MSPDCFVTHVPGLSRPESRVPNPESRIPSPNPESRIPNLPPLPSLWRIQRAPPFRDVGCGVANDAPQLREIRVETAIPVGAQPAQRLRAAVLKSFPDIDNAGLPQHLEVPAQIAVSETAKPLEIGEEPSLSPGQKRNHDAESRFFVERPIEAFVGEAAVIGRRGLRSTRETAWSRFHLLFDRFLVHRRGC
jgi:hypothetical protein